MGSYLCRRLLVFLDGTWNEDIESQPASNIVYLRERLFWGMQTRLREKKKEDQEEFNSLPDEVKKRSIRSMIFDGFEYVVYYHRGVGTGPFLDRITGGMFGSGLEENIRRAYRFLSYWFRPGDEIFVFGFSRGAYTARSLCGYLNAVGLLKREHCTEENETRAWRYYRTTPAERFSADWLYFRNPEHLSHRHLVHDDRSMRVRALGVFDTVGARGIPAAQFWRFNRSRYEFHDTEMGSKVDIRLHALAIDEPRWAFAPTLWTKPKFKVVYKESPTEQVWFPGAHSDIGGGYINWNERERGLSHLPIAWMIQRLKHHLMNTPPIETDGMTVTPTIQPNRKAPIPFYTDDLFPRSSEDVPSVRGEIKALAKKSFQHVPGKLWRMAFWRDPRRIINQIRLEDTRGIKEEGRVSFADPIGEMVHVSAFDRLSGYLKGGTRLRWWLRRFHKKVKYYYSTNLLVVIPYLVATYLQYHKDQTPWSDCEFIGSIFSWRAVRLVDWDGQPLDPQKPEDVVRAFEILPKPDDIAIAKMPGEMQYMDDFIRKVHESGGSIDHL